MKKIMFNDKYGLTKAVLEGRKTMTRRIVSDKMKEVAGTYRLSYYADTLDALSFEDALLEFSPLKVGEVVAVAQKYSEMNRSTFVSFVCEKGIWKKTENSSGWSNKMFVSADLMPHQIRITNVRVERLQDIGHGDCILEGITTMTEGKYEVGNGFGWDTSIDATKRDTFFTPREAFAALIDKVSGKGTWENNPYCFCYTFELVK